MRDIFDRDVPSVREQLGTQLLPKTAMVVQGYRRYGKFYRDAEVERAQGAADVKRTTG